MTADLIALCAAADWDDADERAMLADAFEEAGRGDDAEALRGEDGAALTDPPCHVTDVVQVTGYVPPDEFGRRMAHERRVTVVTDYADHCAGASSRREWALLWPAQRSWWCAVLRDLHRARVRLASAAPDVREF